MLAKGSSSWATPQAYSTQGSNTPTQVKLDIEAKNWQTPTTMDSEQAGGKGRKARRNKSTLSLDAELWATPRSKEGNEDYAKLDRSRTGLDLKTQSALWPSPQARDERSGEAKADYGNSRPLNEAVLSFSLPVLDQTSGRPLSPTRRILRRRLNPAFVCWLMGWPMWWTRAEPISFAAQETGLWRSRLRLLLRSYFEGQV